MSDALGVAVRVRTGIPVLETSEEAPSSEQRRWATLPWAFLLFPAVGRRKATDAPSCIAFDAQIL
jgi:hypothetical protein